MDTMTRYLGGRMQVDGVWELSEPRAYHHDESDYDRQYGVEALDREELKREGANLLALCRKHGMPAGKSAVEVGCGTGRISVGLAMQEGLEHLLITDASSAFCRLVRKKLEQVEVKAGRVDFGVLRAEDVGTLPGGEAGLIVLRSVLHHVGDVPGFLAGCAKMLAPGGLLICEEPYYEGYMMMGFLGQILEVQLREQCSEEERGRLAYFTGGMQFYCRRDIDKSNDEDKHLFRPEELMVSGREVDLELTHYPNWRFTMSAAENQQARKGYFRQFFRDYVRYCLDWPAEFATRVADAADPYFGFFDLIEQGETTAPHCFGTFVFTKRRAGMVP